MEPPRPGTAAVTEDGAGASRRSAPARPSEPDLEPLPTLTGPLRCAAHRKVETYLRCGKCEKPICPRCMIQTPVGARCRSCAGLRRLPTFDVRPFDLLRGFVGGVAAAAVGALALAYVTNVPGVGFFGFMLMALLGYVVGEATSASARRKRGRWLGWAAVVAVPLGLTLGRVGFFIVLGGYPAGVALAGSVAMLVTPIWSLLLLGLAMWIAYQRVA